MDTLRKNWAFILIGIVSLLLGGLAILTAIRLNTTEPVAPTVPTKQQALEGDPVPACQLSFSLAVVASPSPTPGTSPSPSPSSSSSPSPSVSPTPTPSVTPTPTPLTCNSTCSSSSQCSSNLVCYITAGQSVGVCRHPSCQTESDCSCLTTSPAPSVSPTPTPSVTPTVPKSGTAWPTIFLIAGGMLLLVIGFAL